MHWHVNGADVGSVPHVEQDEALIEENNKKGTMHSKAVKGNRSRGRIRITLASRIRIHINDADPDSKKIHVCFNTHKYRAYTKYDK